MANIVINEISQNYTYNIGNNSYATVALPITASWGPGYFDPQSFDTDTENMLDSTTWNHFPATQAGLEAFVATYRGPVSNYRIAQDYSYQMAMTLLTAGYDVLVCRVSPGSIADGEIHINSGSTNYFHITSKYPGSFGNMLQIQLQKVNYSSSYWYWSAVTYYVDPNTGVRSALENIGFTLDPDKATDSIPYITEVESDYIRITTTGSVPDDAELVDPISTVQLSGGADIPYYDTEKSPSQVVNEMIPAAAELAKLRYGLGDAWNPSAYGQAFATLTEPSALQYLDLAQALAIYQREWVFNRVVGTSTLLGNDPGLYSLLTDKLTYAPSRIISPGWDDQDILYLLGSAGRTVQYEALPDVVLSPMHKRLMEVAYYSRCGTAHIDIPRAVPRSKVYTQNAGTSTEHQGYAQKLSDYRLPVASAYNDVNSILFSTHSALFAPWGQYTFVGSNMQTIASPSFLALMIQRAQILNQAIQYEWALPTNRKHNLRIGKMDYEISKKYLDQWQKLEGVGVNCITKIPDLGTNIWGNSTLYDVPPATYQALANLSTRYLVNAVENVAYKCGLNITFQYNNDQAYNKFYAGVTPLLDTMKNVGAIDDYYVKMAADIRGLDHVNANTVLGKIFLVINGVINDIYIDLIALPPTSDLNQYRQ